ncbi:MAG TPA: SpoIIE family protein phosphatase [Gemmataceae bacterium]|nr:SpoIIE family protein phosphatase [Gemmataceae bacterium]
MASLQVVKGSNKGAEVSLEKGDKWVMGRNADCQVVINLPSVSREHAIIRLMQGKFFIEDLKSRNGTTVNNAEIKVRTELNHNDQIKICDSLFTFVCPPKPALPKEIFGHVVEDEVADTDDGEESSSTVEATIASGSKQVLLEMQSSEKLAFLVEVTSDLTQTFDLDKLLPKIADSLFQVFRQADRAFIILADEDNPNKLIPKVIKTRRAQEESMARFSRRIVQQCMETAQALLSEDASADKRFDLSQSIADCRIRSVMCAPLTMRSTGKGFGVIQLDTQDRHKKFTAEDLKLLMAVAGQAAIALENAKLHDNLVARAGLERDLRLAHQVQMSFLPKKPPVLEGYEFFAHYESAQEIGGDYYDFIPLPGPRLGIALGDVAGKGVPAALLMAKVSSEARFCMLTEKGPAEAVFRLNALMQEAGMLDRFVTFAVGLLDPSTHQVTFVNAGHLPPLIYRAATGKVEEGTSLDASGFPLGVAEGIPYEAVTVELGPGDSVALFTDGITEAKNKQEVEFQWEGARAVLGSGVSNAQVMGQRLVAAVRQHALGCKQHDDITVVCFGRAPE